MEPSPRTTPGGTANHIVDSDVIFWNGGRVFATSSTGCSGAYYIEDIAAHELGHGLGLDHSYFVDSAGKPPRCTRASARATKNFRSLSSDDVAGVQSVYGASSTGGSTGYTSPDGTTVPGATQIVDNLGAVWTIGASGAILRNGLQAAYGWGSTILWTSSTIYVRGGDYNWWRWTGSGWVNSRSPTAGRHDAGRQHFTRRHDGAGCDANRGQSRRSLDDWRERRDPSEWPPGGIRMGIDNPLDEQHGLRVERLQLVAVDGIRLGQQRSPTAGRHNAGRHRVVCRQR